MTKSTGQEREERPGQAFALPDRRRFPTEDAAHARNAGARAAQAKKGGAPSRRDRRTAEADAVIERG